MGFSWVNGVLFCNLGKKNSWVGRAGKWWALWELNPGIAWFYEESSRML